MANIERVRVALTGFKGGPGVCTFYAIDGAAALEPLHTMFTDFVGSMPDDVSVQVENVGDVISDTTGALVGSWSGTPQTVLAGSQAGIWTGGAGAQVTWTTNTILDGHRVKGRTYIVPLGGLAYENDGTLTSGVVAGFKARGEDLVAAVSGNMLIWHRPRKARAADGSRPAVAARAGASVEIVGAEVADRAALLRSRRG